MPILYPYRGTLSSVFLKKDIKKFPIQKTESSKKGKVNGESNLYFKK
ncbi:hypothetical protein ELI_4660 [Eubacterium callanderi]|uniref:Uncharacterized protein n=1 Tax=Eubacterium callanderi TaxID=53442 RepID=E3GEN6_9FIRM|nr:hypothetical protein ELI_3183 [Eubacterium callanderi]AEU12328.1 hypothetical protein ELI_4660 [Eubacterium callanderi]